MKKVTGVLIGLVAMALMSFGSVTAQAAGTVKIGGVSVDKSYLLTSTYYRTTRAVTAHVTYYKATNADTHKTGTLTLPKGTVVSGWFIPKHHLANGRWGMEMSIFSDQLNYALMNSRPKKGYHVSAAVSYNLKSFKKVKAPAYLPTYSIGNLYLGGAKVAKRGQDAAKQTVQITSNGYVEVHHLTKLSSETDLLANKPVSSAKIMKTRVKGAVRYLYLNKKLKGHHTVRVGKQGAYQYRLAFKNLHQPQNLSAYDDDRGEIYDFDSLYSLGGVTYFTPICFGSEIED